MSILNGKIGGAVIFEETPPYGKRLAESTFIPLSGCMDVALLDETHLVAACSRELKIFDISGKTPVLMSNLGGLGESRQLAVYDGFAFVTARADGLYICDLRDPLAPSLSARVDTLELATGVAVKNGLLCVANRHMGVEVWDVSKPSEPVFISDFLAGEAQSVYLDGDVAYTGDWMNKTVHIHSLADPLRPVELSSFAVDGFADGVLVRDGICYAATGHHAARLKNRKKYNDYRFLLPEMLTDGYGCGHGFELFDVSDPSSPEFLSSVKLPPFFGGTDTWRVFSDGRNAYVCDSHNGFFTADVTTPTKPFLTGYFRLPPKEQNPESGPPTIQRLCKAVCGAAASDGRLFLAGPETGLHALDFPGASRFDAPSASRKVSVSAAERRERPVTDAFFSCGAQVHTVAFADSALFVACGEEGLYALDPADGNPLFHTVTPGLCHDVQCGRGLVYTAEGQAGATVYRFDRQNGFRELDRADFGGRSAREVVVSGEDVFVELGNGQIASLTLTEGKLAHGEVCSGRGMLYHRHLCRELASGLLCACPLNVGPALFATSGHTLTFTGAAFGSQVCPIEEGAAACGSGLILIIGRKYLYLERPEELAGLDRSRFAPVVDARLAGIPFVCGKRLALLNRCTGICELLDVTEPSAPRFIGRKTLAGHPEHAVEKDGYIWVSCGHAGLFRL